MKKISYRQVHLDFHTSPLIENIGSDFKLDDFIQTIKEADIESINIFSKCHHGLSYYPTKYGKMHPHLNFDLLGSMIKGLKEAEITAPIYFTTGWEEVSADNSDWLEVNKDGQLGDVLPFDNAYYKWRKLCHNKPGYIQFIKDQVKEIVDLYGQVDGFWFDIVVQHNCVCKDCIKSMKELGLNPENDADLQKHDYIVVEAFMKEIREYCTEILPEGLIFFNGPYGPDGGYDPLYSIDNKVDHMTHLEIESLPSDRWGYNHFPLFVNYHNHREKEIIGMNGKFHTAWGDFGSLRNKEAMDYECFRMLMNGSKICIGDQLHPNGKMDQLVYERIGHIFSRVKTYEPWLGGKKLTQIGVVSSNRGAFENYQIDEGLMRMCLELQVPFDFINVSDDFSKYEVIVLPDEVYLCQKTKEKFDDYVSKGGKIIATHHSGTGYQGEKLEVLPRHIEDNPFEPSYMRFKKDIMKAYGTFDLVNYKRGSIVESKGQVLAYIGNPYFNRTYDRFCSHRQAPFKELTDHPAVMASEDMVYIAYPIFDDYMEYGAKVLRDTFELALSLMIDKALIESDLPSTAELALWEKDHKKLLHVVHYIAQKKSKHIEIVDAMIPLYNKKFRIKTEKVSRVYLVPSLKEIDFDFDGEYVSFELDIEGYQLAVIE
ncbi:hypothetical protein EZV73_18840 [Acidaminobacter sp. JC074]|uniref:alpha-amylase family protein n=1 Tax=Acidaminobacter sp. JC074 TaxID=2530199 RepID=UPI001F1137A0|nr:alpha-amylase family protein [Acidaminobacter sp. JC074]MCH4889647.1 hypothetical protein [Acidaminobacter sp. JC074]